MKTIANFIALALAVSIIACVSIQVGSEVNSGRRAFLIGNNESALAYFQSAAQKDSNYVYGTALRQGIWSYVGRAEYANGRLPQAKESLERALVANQNEPVARLYLGLTLARQGDRQRGLKEIEAGIKGIYDWLEYVTQAFRFSFGQYWDPNGQIRKAIENDLAMISSREFDWEKLIVDAEWVGLQIEEESDRARGDETRARNRESDGGRSSRH
ncbi:MAG: tetratricopeptide repeat protein [Candidatus Binatia bacterium]